MHIIFIYSDPDKNEQNAMHKNATTYEIYIVLSSLLKTAIMIPSALENGIALVH